MLKTAEDVQRAREACMALQQDRIAKINKACDAALKLVTAGIPCELDYIGAGLMWNETESTVAHKIAKAFGVKFEKKPHFGTDTHVDYDGKLDGVSMRIYGTIPPGCKVVYEDVKVLEHTERKARLICGGEKDDKV